MKSTPHNIWMILVLFVLCGLAAPSSYAQADCNLRLSEASKLYQRGFFNRTVDLLSSCKRFAFADKEAAIDAYRLVALSFIALDQEKDAHKWVRNIIALDRKFVADANDLLRFRELVDEYRPANRTLLVGSLGAAAALTTVLLLTREESPPSESPLPGPITLPQ